MLDAHGIQCTVMHGKMPQRARANVLDQFRTGSPGSPRVLRMSSIGQVGLNMAFANVMIIAVSPSFCPVFWIFSDVFLGRPLVCTGGPATHRAHLAPPSTEVGTRVPTDRGGHGGRLPEQ